MGLNSVPLQIHAHPEAQNVTLFGNMVFADGIREGLLDLGWALRPETGVLIRTGEDTERQRKDSRVKTGAEPGVAAAAQECQGHQKLEEAGRTLPRVPRGSWPC